MKYIILTALLLVSCKDDNKFIPPPAPYQGWSIGPIINGKNYSVNMPLQMVGNTIEFGPDAEPHYVTKPTGSIANASVIRMRFNIEGGKIYGKGCGEASVGTISLYFQQKNDGWRTDGSRWWTAPASLDHEGEYEIIAPLDGIWGSVMTMNSSTNPMEFTNAKINAGQIGFTFGNCEGLGHGVRATGPVKFTLIDYGVE